jgi:hypothetical protein
MWCCARPINPPQENFEEQGYNLGIGTAEVTD